MSIDTVELAHPLREIPFGCFYKKVVVVVHEAICMNDEAKPFHEVIQKAEEIRPILLVPEYVLPVIPPGRHMVEGTGIFNPERTSHKEVYQK